MVAPFGCLIVAPYSMTAPMLTISSPSLLIVPRNKPTKALSAMIFWVMALMRKPVSMRALLEPLRLMVLSASLAKGWPPGDWERMPRWISRTRNKALRMVAWRRALANWGPMPAFSLVRTLSQSPVRLTPMELNQLKDLVGDSAEKMGIFDALYFIGFAVRLQPVFT